MVMPGAGNKKRKRAQPKLTVQESQDQWMPQLEHHINKIRLLESHISEDELDAAVTELFLDAT
eukprot:805696-Amphidinium_carterae.1